MTATAPSSADPGQIFSLQFGVSEPSWELFEDHELPFEVADDSNSCKVNTARELMVTRLLVVDDHGVQAAGGD